MSATDIGLIIGASVLHLLGIVGSVVPVLPGAPLGFIGMILCCVIYPNPVIITLTVIMGLLMVCSIVLDYVAPSILTNKAGGSKYAVWGTNIGLVVGLIFALFGIIFAPLAIILGPFLGALVGELIHSHNFSLSLKIAAYSLLSFVIGTLFKLIICIVMLIISVANTVFYYFFA